MAKARGFAGSGLVCGGDRRRLGLPECSVSTGALFEVKEKAFAFEASAVAAQGAGGFDDAVAWDDDGDSVGAVGHADGACAAG